MEKDLSCNGEMIAFGVGVCALAAVLFGASGCIGGGAVVVPANGVAVVGDAEGIRALGDWQVGAITEARNDPRVKSAYWQGREKREEEATKRKTAPGFWGKLVAGMRGQ